MSDLLTSTPNTIRAAVSPQILSKADRLFSNKLSDILIELLQNARRAGATKVEVLIEETKTGSRVTLIDDGEGIEDFSVLLHLGQSEWDPGTSEREDPAGMGFFALLHSGVTVRSRGKEAVIDREGFLGAKAIDVVDRVTTERGTTLLFERNDKPQVVHELLKSAVRYGRLPVVLNGEALPQQDFLEGAATVKEISGVRIGVYRDPAYYHWEAWNFHGKTIRDSELPSLSRVLIGESGNRGELAVRIDVLEARHIHLKLPDRTDIVRDEAHTMLCREAKIAMYEYLATLPEHHASFEQYSEARRLGIDLKEASPVFRSFHVAPAYEGTGDDLFGGRSRITAEPTKHAIVDKEELVTERFSFTLAIALEYFEEMSIIPIDDHRQYRGYSWYAAIPRLKIKGLLVDGEDLSEIGLGRPITIAKEIRLDLLLERAGQQEEPLSLSLPFAGLLDDDYGDEYSLAITEDSPWKQDDRKNEPFSLVEAAVYLAFRPSDDVESDSTDTQLEYFTNTAHAAIVEALGGPVARARYELEEALLKWDLSNALRDAHVTEIHLRRGDTTGWSIEMNVAHASPDSPEA